MEKAELSGLAVPGAEISVRVTPRAARNDIRLDGGLIRISVTAPPERGKATKAATRQLARALGVAPSRLTVIRGATARHKVFRIG